MMKTVRTKDPVLLLLPLEFSLQPLLSLRFFICTMGIKIFTCLPHRVLRIKSRSGSLRAKCHIGSLFGDKVGSKQTTSYQFIH